MALCSQEPQVRCIQCSTSPHTPSRYSLTLDTGFPPHTETKWSRPCWLYLTHYFESVNFEWNNHLLLLSSHFSVHYQLSIWYDNGEITGQLFILLYWISMWHFNEMYHLIFITNVSSPLQAQWCWRWIMRWRRYVDGSWRGKIVNEIMISNIFPEQQMTKWPTVRSRSPRMMIMLCCSWNYFLIISSQQAAEKMV